jgi:hypothetical protein
MANNGDFNSALGIQALESNTSGSNNVAVGRYAGQNLTTGDNNINVGANVSGSAGESNTIRIGATQTAAYLAGVYGTNVGAVSPVLVNSNGQLGVNTSSRRFKTEVRPLRLALGGLMKLRPISFRYKANAVQGPNPTEFGLLAEQVARVYPNLVTRDQDGKPYAVLYQQLPALLLAQVQRQQGRINSQASRIRALRQQNLRQRVQMDAVRARLRGIGRLRAKVSWLMRRAGHP